MAEKKNFLLRLNPKLWDALQRCSAQELRSVNSQIEFMLKEALARRGFSPDGEKPGPPAGQDAENGGE